MPISKAAEGKITKWLSSKLTRGCPMCGQQNWTILDELQMASNIDLQSKGVSMGTGIPLVLTTCNHCGFVAPYLAGKLGLL